MRETDLQTVRNLELFRDITAENFDALIGAAFLQRFPAGVELIAEGEPADFLYVAMEGSVALYASANNRESVIAIVRPVSTFILAAALKDAAYLMSARTLAPSRLLMIPSENVRNVFALDTAFARAVVWELSTRFREMVKALKNQKLRAGLERLANYLLILHAEQGSTGAVDLAIDKSTLASLLGMAPENLSRALATLRVYGVEVIGTHIRLTKLDDLASLAKPTSLIDDPYR
ncbi:MAG: cyclic nucleotide-binding domain-containing protein [Rhodomicrobium sp.]